MISKTLLLVTFTLIPFLLLYIFYSPAIDSLSNYINVQVIDSLKNAQTTNNRFSIINELFNQLRFIHFFGSISIFFYIIFIFRKQILLLLLKFKILFIAITIVILSYFIVELYVDTGNMQYIKSSVNYLGIIFYFLLLILIYLSRKNSQLTLISSERIKWMILFILLGFSGVLPMAISLKQGGFYILTALPYFSISFVILIIPILHYIVSRFSVKRGIIYLFMLPLFILYGPFFSYTSQITIPYIISWKLNSLKYQYEMVGRDSLLLNDIKLILTELPEDAIVNIDFETKWSIHGYFARHENISLDIDQRNQHNYLISFEDGWNYNERTGKYIAETTDFQNNRKIYKQDYKKIEINTNKLHLYKYQPK